MDFHVKWKRGFCSRALLLSIISIHLSGFVFGQPPNDEPCSAITLTVNSTCTYSNYTNQNATASPSVPAPGCSSYLGGDVWFQATVPAGGSLIFDTQLGVMTDGGMAIYSGTCGALNLIACDDDGSINGLMPRINATGLTPGSTIWIRIWAYDNDENGSFGICVAIPPPAPANDDPCNAVLLTVNSTCTYSNYTNESATASTGIPAPGCSSYLGGDVWFRVTVPAGGSLIFDSQIGTMTDGGMAIYGGTCGSLTLIACDDDASNNGLMPRIDATGLTPGSTLWIRVWSYDNDDNGIFGICVATPPPPPANDDPCNAVTLTINSVCVYSNYTNESATPSTVPDPGCSSYLGGDIWFKITVPAGGSLIFDTQTGAMTDGGMAIYGGTCGALTLIACDDDASNNGLMPMISATGLTPGSTVWIRIWSYDNDNNGSFGICVATPPSAATNNNCSSAISLAVNAAVTGGTTLGATLETGEIVDCAPVGTNQSVWYSFVATATNMAVTITQIGGTCNPYLSSAVWRSSGSCPSLGGCHAISCQAADNGPDTTVHSLSNLTIGATYYVQVLYLSDAVCGASAEFTIGVSTTIPANPSNPPPVSTCQSPSGPVCVFNFNPTAAQVNATCTPYTNPPSADSTNEVVQMCFTFTAQYSSTISISALLNTFCPTSGNVIWFHWQIYNSSCISVACGSLSNLTATGLVCGNTYTICYSYEIPDCRHVYFVPYLVSIPPVLTVTANGSPVSTTICGGSTATLNASAAGYTSYTWSPATGLSATTGASVTATPAVTTTYTVTGFDAGGCSQSKQITVNVNPPVTPAFNPVAAICSGATAPVLPTTSTNGITGTWSPATVSNTATATYTFTPTTGQCATTTTLTVTVNPNVTPTFNPVAAICNGATAPVLPATSTNGVNGTWSPATVSNTATATYTFTPTAGQCATTTTLTVTVNPNVTPTFNPVAAICNGATPPILPTTSTNGINGAWAPATVSNTTTTTYTFTPTAGQCATATTLTVTVNPNITPAFNPVAAICSGATAPVLPTTSTNGITGTWAPATVSNTATATYTFTPTAGQCATTTTLTVTVNPNVTPTFNPVAAICSGATAPVLPTTSTNGITGTWAPATVSNTATATYTFTPTAGPCATTTTLTVTVNPNVTPTFAAIGPLCQNSTPPALQATSINGITGTWSPATINTTTNGTTTYTFTPTAGQCATTATLDIVITTQIPPTFAAIGPLCQNSTAPALPATSTNGITGAWSPATINTATIGTTTYTFTPNPGQCAATGTLDIAVTTQSTPTFAAIGPLCQNSAAPTLPATSTNGITGTWSPATINTATAGTITYTFTPNGGQCAVTATLSITIDPQITPGFAAIGPLCQSSTAPTLPATSTNGIAGTWSPVTINTAAAGTTAYTFTPNGGQCATTATLNITIDPKITPGFAAIGPLCQNSTAPILPSTSINGITGTWSPATINTATTGTTSYTFTPTAGLCATAATLDILVTTQITPTFATIGPLCQNSTAPALPATSNNSITGTWSPATINTATNGTTTYTFTPAAGQCAITTTLDIVVTTQITPTFAAIGPLCQNSTAPALPATSINGITGTWNPAAINTSATGATTYNFTPNVGQCAGPTSLSVTVNPNITPAFNPIAAICNGAAAPVLPTTSTNGITGTWAPATVSNTATATYTFTPTAGLCATTTTLTVTVNPNTTPTFNPVAAICNGATAPVLSTTSTNGITGTWTPATVSNTATATYTFTPTAGLCATTTTLIVTVNPNVTPTFNPLAAICNGATAPVLPTTSTNGITGTWAPATVSNTATATYTFTPTAGQCATTTTLTVTVNPNVTPTFNPVAAICSGATAPVLPTTSTNGITGTWAPATVSNTATATYTFTPTAGQCATTTTLTVTVNPNVTPTFNPVAAICSGATAPVLPTTSVNGITGTWNPATVSNTATATYTFTPTAGLCVTTTTLTVTVNPNVTPAFNPVAAICRGAAAPVLPTTSINGITGTWNPATVSNTATATYTFTPTAGQCASATTLTVTVNPIITPTFNPVAAICRGAVAPVLPVTSTNGITGTWSPATVSNTVTATYTFTPTAGQCGTTTTLTITVNPVFTTSQAVSICQGQSYTLPWGVVVTTTGVYSDTVRYTNGCDSLRRTVNLQVKAAVTSITSPSICSDETYMLPWGVIVNTAGTYQDTLRTTGGCDSLIRVINLTVNPVPSITLIKSNDINCFIGISQLIASGGSQYLWSPAGTLSNPSASNPVASPGATTTYSVKVTSADGCDAEDSITVIVNTGGANAGFALPNAFTPNGDGKNDCFGVQAWGAMTELRFSIFNRWGELVFSTTDPSKCWDGRFKGAEQPSSVFVYQVSAKTNCGDVSRKGTVVLIR